MWFFSKGDNPPKIEVVKRAAGNGFVDWVIRRTKSGYEPEFLGVNPKEIYWWTSLEHVRSHASFPDENAAISRFEKYIAEQGPFKEEIVRST